MACGLLIAVASPIAEHALRLTGFSNCSRWVSIVMAHGLQWLRQVGSRALTQYLRNTGLAALRHVGSWIRDQTHVSA